MTGPERFTGFVAIDWSGARVERPPGLAVAYAAPDGPPALLTPRGGWSRPGIRDWLLAHARAKTPLLIGLDLSTALPVADAGSYFPGWSRSPPDARTLWRLVDDLAAGDPHLSVGSFLADPEAARHFRQAAACGDLFPAGAGRFRVCELCQKAMGLNPYSCFNLVGAAQVGKSSLTGMRVLNAVDGRIPIWPFDPPPADGPVLVEIYTTIAALAAGRPKNRSKMRDAASLDEALCAVGSPAHRRLPRYDDHKTDALLSSAWLRHVAGQTHLWQPKGLIPEIARTEGWTFGVP